MQPARVELQVELGGDADRAVHRVRHRRRDRCGLAGAGLGERRAQRGGQRAVARAADLRRHVRGDDVLGHHGELVLDRLELADRAAELDALVGERDGQLQDALQRTGEKGGGERGAGLAPGNRPRAGAGTRQRRGPAQIGAQAAMHAARASFGARGRQHAPAVASRDDDRVGDAAVRRPSARDRAVVADLRCAGDRDRASGDLDPVARQQRARQHRVRDRQRHRVPTFDGEQREGVGEAQTRTAGRLGNERVEEAGTFDRRPKRVRTQLRLRSRAPSPACTRRRAGGRTAPRARSPVHPRAAHGPAERDGAAPSERPCGRTHRNPSPRAIRPRSTSRVPPRSENVGANWVM